MNCRKAQKWLPLYSGGDLPLHKARKMETHIRNCRSCRQELRACRQSIEAARKLMRRVSVLGSQPAWDRALSRALTPTSADRVRLSLRPAWNYAAMALLAALLTFLVVKPLPDLESYSRNREASASAQDVISITLVSQETGLKVQWFLNRKFSLKEDSE